jgi:hypothetical protein
MGVRTYSAWASVFYELLTGRRPFRGESLPRIVEQVTQAEARPPRPIDDTIPRELERIDCFGAGRSTIYRRRD